MSSGGYFKLEELEDFPPLGAKSSNHPQTQSHIHTSAAITSGLHPQRNILGIVDESKVRRYTKSNNGKEKKHLKTSAPSTNLRSNQVPARHVLTGTDFVNARVGLLFNNYSENLDQLVKTHVGHSADFIVTPIEPLRSYQLSDNFQVIPDLVVPINTWQTSVALSLGCPNLDSYNSKISRRFADLLAHAIYLPVRVLLIDTPITKLGCLSLASIVNDCLIQNASSVKRPTVLFKLPLVRKSRPSVLSGTTSLKRATSNSLDSGWISASDQNTISENCPSTSTQSLVTYNHGWSIWNDLRSHLNPDSRIGVCLVIDDEVPDTDEESEELERWTGEPVRMVVVTTDQFIHTSTTVRMLSACRRFIRKVGTFNSLKTSFVLQATSKLELKPYIDVLAQITKNLRKEVESTDALLDWHDRLLAPLQPLSSNLDSETYDTFEIDSIKYIVYRDAMVEAIETLIARDKTRKGKFILMVLGAGRGPLVDRFIEAVHTAGMQYRFKIYALDKNKSSVRSLMHKKNTEWLDNTGTIETEVVEADMREWQPQEKADIIATELLGSFGDNELSPECIDGLWRFASPGTINIPQFYTSYLAPISSHKMHQQLYSKQGRNPFDKIYVVNLVNCYYIDETQRLFDFNHEDISQEPKKYQNERYRKLSFISKVDTICHGFAGFFSAKLFGSVELSTVLNGKTPTMNSWFAAYIPIQQPINLPKNTKLTVHFWRKETDTKVWYQWAITEPVSSRIYSPVTLSYQSEGTMMSKFIS